MKVYSGWLIRRRDWPETDPDKPWVRQVDGIVAAKSRAALRRTLEERYGDHVGDAFLRDFWSETGNEIAIETALSEPGVLFIKSMQGGPNGRVWRRVTPRDVDVTPP